MGTLCSFDQFANAVLEGAWERVIVGEQYCDIPLGLYVIRGENVVLVGKGKAPQLKSYKLIVPCAQKVEREASELRGTMRKRMEFLDFD
ncbi:hypothetical protein Bca4012_068819 [Brassica carinata]